MSPRKLNIHLIQMAKTAIQMHRSNLKKLTLLAPFKARFFSTEDSRKINIQIIQTAKTAIQMRRSDVKKPT